MKKIAPTHSMKVGREENTNKDNRIFYTQCDLFEQFHIDIEQPHYPITVFHNSTRSSTNEGGVL